MALRWEPSPGRSAARLLGAGAAGGGVNTVPYQISGERAFEIFLIQKYSYTIFQTQLFTLNAIPPQQLAILKSIFQYIYSPQNFKF